MDRFAALLRTFILYVRCRCRSYECQAPADVRVYGGMLGPRMCAVGKLSGFYNKRGNDDSSLAGKMMRLFIMTGGGRILLSN